MSDERLRALLERYLDGVLDDAEREELEQTLRSSAAARAQFWQDTRLHSLLHEVERTEAGGSGAVPSAKAIPRRWSRLVLVLAVALGIAAAAWWWRHHAPSERAEPRTAAIVAQLRVAPGARWAAENPSPLLHAGSFELLSGLAEILLANGSMVVVQAPAVFSLDSPERFTVSTGRLRAEAGTSPLDLRTPAGNWTVKEAGIGLRVAERTAEAHVFAGSITSPGGAPLATGAAVRFSRGSSEPTAFNARQFPTASRTLPVPFAAASFEDAAGHTREGIPSAFGHWSGDHVAAVTAERGITPLQGTRMLRFLHAEPLSAAEGSALISSEQWQLIDLQPWREKLGGGGATLEFAAWFNRLPGPTSTRKFGIGVFACRGQPSAAPELWKNLAQQLPGHAGTQILADDDPATWERAAAQFTVPEDADYLIITVTCVRLPRQPLAPREFEGHYADDATLTLQIPPRRGQSPGP